MCVRHFGYTFSIQYMNVVYGIMHDAHKKIWQMLMLQSQYYIVVLCRIKQINLFGNKWALANDFRMGVFHCRYRHIYAHKAFGTFILLEANTHTKTHIAHAFEVPACNERTERWVHLQKFIVNSCAAFLCGHAGHSTVAPENFFKHE